MQNNANFDAAIFIEVTARTAFCSAMASSFTIAIRARSRPSSPSRRAPIAWISRSARVNSSSAHEESWYTMKLCPNRLTLFVADLAGARRQRRRQPQPHRWRRRRRLLPLSSQLKQVYLKKNKIVKVKIWQLLLLLLIWNNRTGLWAIHRGRMHKSNDRMSTQLCYHFAHGRSRHVQRHDLQLQVRSYFFFLFVLKCLQVVY